MSESSPRVRRDFHNYYEAPDFPARHYICLGRRAKSMDGKDIRVWKFDVRGMLFDPVDGLLSGLMAWDPCLYPSYGSGMSTLWNNVLQFLTPFYFPRRSLIEAVIENNGMKLLSHDRKTAYLRTRGEDCKYLSLSCGLVTATVREVRYVSLESGKGICTFAAGNCSLREESRVLAKGPCLTFSQCDRLLSEVVRAFPEAGWFFNERSMQ